MSPLEAMFVGFAIVWGGLFLFVLRLHRISKALEEELLVAQRQKNP